MNINELSDNITKWLETQLTPDKIDSLKHSIGTFLGFDTFQHNIDRYTSWLSSRIGNGKLTMWLLNGIDVPMPDAYNDFEKVLEQLFK
jgi:hypothetical protein